MSTYRCYFAFNLLYGVASVCAIMTGVAFFSYAIVLQATLIAVILLPFGVLVSALEPDPMSGKVRRKPRVIFLTASLVSLACLFICAIYPIETLVSQCSGEQSFTHNTLDVSVHYSALDEATGTQQEHELLLQYNLTEKRLVHSQLIAPPDAPEEKTWLQSFVQQQRMQTESVYTGVRVSRFRLLSDEVEQGLRERHHTASHKPSMRVSPHHSDDQGYERLHHLRERLQIREICRYEYGATILYIIYIAALAVLEIFALLWYTFQVQGDGDIPMSPLTTGLPVTLNPLGETEPQYK